MEKLKLANNWSFIWMLISIAISYFFNIKSIFFVGVGLFVFHIITGIILEMRKEEQLESSK